MNDDDDGVAYERDGWSDAETFGVSESGYFDDGNDYGGWSPEEEEEAPKPSVFKQKRAAQRANVQQTKLVAFRQCVYTLFDMQQGYFGSVFFRDDSVILSFFGNGSRIGGVYDFTESDGRMQLRNAGHLNYVTFVPEERDLVVIGLGSDQRVRRRFVNETPQHLQAVAAPAVPRDVCS